ncbi:hypothetical protein [Castellaniella sp. S9]|uniref:hypothetical protein n=1 Tax=Castellaniella sp. S9 TaxID=2993652 RepID=UPI0022B2CF52|nr:hypothetical protein [Castellaniella sp. S9]
MSLFADVCWRHWPKACTCPPSADEIERMKSDVFLLGREVQRENRRAREFSEALADLVRAVCRARDVRMADGGEDNVPADIQALAEQAKQAADLLREDRNQDRVTELMKRIEGKS